MNPFEDWDTHNPGECGACEEFGVVPPFDLITAIRAVDNLTPEPGHWPNPASLSRFNAYEMDSNQLRRFMAMIEPRMIDWHTPCWLWTGATHKKGYGRFHLGVVDGKRIPAYSHRISFEHFVTFPPAGYIVDHQCNHKLCCNPTHLWPETNNDNLRLADQRRPWKRRNQYSQE